MTDIEKEAEAFVNHLDEVARRKKAWEYISDRSSLIARLQHHRGACIGSIDWFSDGQKALAKLGQGSEVYDRAVKNGQECLEELDRLIAGLGGQHASAE